jgi:molybdate transport system substrate-binding protein
MRNLLKTALVAVLVLGASCGVRAQNEVTLVTLAGIRPPIDELLHRFEEKTGQKVKTVYGSVGVTRKHVLDGDAFDLAVVLDPDSDVLASSNIVSGSATTVASLVVGGAVAHGAPKPDISTPEALKRTLLAEKSISYSDPSGGSAAGTSFADTLKALGIAGQVQPKAKVGKGGGEAMASVAKGEAEIGFVFYNEINEPGVDVVGPLPAQVSPPIRLVGFISSHAKNPAAAKALAEFLSSPEAAAVFKAHRILPGS